MNQIFLVLALIDITLVGLLLVIKLTPDHPEQVLASSIRGQTEAYDDVLATQSKVVANQHEKTAR